jgi:hypothetical protein
MIHAHLSEKRAVPWWAAIGAPLVGVPLMIGLLALAAPKDSGPEAKAVEERQEIESVVHPVQLPAEYMEMERTLERG